MGHGKLKKFLENESFGCLLQPHMEEVVDLQADGLVLKDHPMKGHWNERMFAKPQPIVLELGCGRGEYTIDLALRNPECNYIGVDIKGARLWKGAKYATVNQLPNVAFLRTRVEFIEAFFAPGEIAEIWLTFSDPQLKSENSRLTSPRFLTRYRNFLQPGGLVHLKTDSRFLHEYTKAVCQVNGLPVLAATTDLYATPPESLFADGSMPADRVAALYEVRTYYERLFMEQGYKITYLCTRIDRSEPYLWPGDSFDADYWKATEGPRRTYCLPEG